MADEDHRLVSRISQAEEHAELRADGLGSQDPAEAPPICVAIPNASIQQYSSSQNKIVQVTKYCPGRPYTELQVPPGMIEVHRIVFTIESHDQGFCGTPELAGTYLASFTWFDAGVATMTGRNDIPRKHVQSNVTATWAFKEHVITWDLCTADESLREWMGKIQTGDTIQLFPRAQFQAWVNHVKSATIELHCKMIDNDESSSTVPESPVTTTYNERGRWSQVEHNYRHHQKLENDQKTIRLLVLHPGSVDDPIHCDLITSSLEHSDMMEFEALSYCWGDATNTKNVSLTHKRMETKPSSSASSANSETQPNFQITSGLDEALRYLRCSDGRKRVLWVDAVCINQSDLQERGFQVDMMGSIYEHASSVVVWLGKSDESSRRGMALVESVSGRDFGWEKIYNSHSFDEVYPRQLGDISRLFSYPWFRRVWVVQEVWKAKSAIVCCGPDSVPWEKVVESNIWMREGHGGGMSGLQLHTLPSIWTKLTDTRKQTSDEESYTGFTLLDLVLEGTELNATDPRDKIFAMLGMGKNPEHIVSLRADYTKTISATFADFTRWLIGEYKSLTILSVIHASPNRTWQDLSCKSNSKYEIQADHPSWAIWHEGNGQWAKRTLGMSGLYKAAGDTLPLISSNSSTHLHLSGLQIGVIQSIHTFPYFLCRDGEFLKAYARLFDPAGENGTWNFGPTFENQKTEIDRSSNEYRTMILDHYIAHWRQYPPQSGNLDGDIEWANDSDDEWTKAGFPCHGKCYFRDKDGNMGFCPPSSRIGDILVVLFGGSVPFVLRERNGPGSSMQYELVGECFVKGQMHGAAIEAQGRGELTEKEFVLV